MNTKKNLIYGSLLLASISLYAFVFPPDHYTTCQDRTATYLDGTETDVSGYCVVTGHVVEFGEIYDLTTCEASTNSTLQKRGCSGNYIVPYPTPF